MDGSITISVRGEAPLDVPEIRKLTIAAFGREDEADLIDRLREDGDVLKSVVALQNGVVVGHAMFSKATIERDGETLEAAALGPMSVAPDRQGEGIGSLLVMRGLVSMAQKKLAAVLVVGHAKFYTQLGFSAELGAKLEGPYSGESFMVSELVKGCLEAGGTYRYPEAFAKLDN